MEKNGLFLLFVIIGISVGLIACEEDTQENPDDKPETEEPNVATNTDKNPDAQQVSPQEGYSESSEYDIVNLVESVDPYVLKPTMTAKERYKIREELYQSLSEEEMDKMSDTIIDLSLLLTGTVANDLYKNLINPSDSKWDALEVSNCYYTREKLETITHQVSDHQPLLDDLNMVIKLCEEGVEQRDVLKIVDAHRILYDISHHLFQDGGIFVNDGDIIHDMYFKASKTLEGSHNLISN
ncbi:MULTISPECIES: hypothetical protein [Oceanobacillus]|uniref:Uncharacterized protein n=1 Tax=Oceanobacillus indicireducens TaxID=1004261 RepID=A0A917Y0W9_9BACI|nr:hypothetical protein [Oceanobacillus indicireducens]GGN60997.1 hypothetical protein GCM10007971_25600 [Oceanobacillus indicireducens]